MAPKTVKAAKSKSETKVCCGTARDIPLSQRDADELASVFAALSDPVRLHCSPSLVLRPMAKCARVIWSRRSESHSPP